MKELKMLVDSRSFKVGLHLEECVFEMKLNDRNILSFNSHRLIHRTANKTDSC